VVCRGLTSCFPCRPSIAAPPFLALLWPSSPSGIGASRENRQKPGAPPRKEVPAQALPLERSVTGQRLPEKPPSRFEKPASRCEKRQPRRSSGEAPRWEIDPNAASPDSSSFPLPLSWRLPPMPRLRELAPPREAAELLEVRRNPELIRRKRCLSRTPLSINSAASTCSRHASDGGPN
jgi:hypothetical protein